MASTDIYNQLQEISKEMQPYLEEMPTAKNYFTEGLNKAFNYNLPLLKEAAGLEAGAYTLPGQLIDQYNTEFGSTFGGASGIARLNSILRRIGNQFSLVDLASGLLDTRKARIRDLANNLTEQYGLGLEGLQTKYNMLLPLYQTEVQREESAANRAAAARVEQALKFPTVPINTINAGQAAIEKLKQTPEFLKSYLTVNQTMFPQTQSYRYQP